MMFTSFIISFNKNKIPIVTATPTLTSETKCVPIATLLIATKVPKTLTTINVV